MSSPRHQMLSTTPGLFDKCPSVGLRSVPWSDSGGGACTTGVDSARPESSDSVDETGLGGKRPFVVHPGRFVNIDCQSASVNVCFGLDVPCTSIDSWSESDGGCTANDPPSCSDAEAKFDSCDPICDACVGLNGSPLSSTRFHDTADTSSPMSTPLAHASHTSLTPTGAARETLMMERIRKDLSNYFVPTHFAPECVTWFRPCSLVAQSS